MFNYLSAVGFRYFSIGLQFLIIVLITHHLSPADSGSYFLIFGAVSTTYYLAGVGLPDGLVKSIALKRASGESEQVRSLVTRAAQFTAIISFALAVVGAIIGYLVGFSVLQIAVAVAWWLCYGAVFFCAQCLLAMGWASLGSFFFYPAANSFQIALLLPFFFLVHDVGLDDVLLITVVSALGSVVAAIICLAIVTGRLPRTIVNAPLMPAFSLGFTICVSRVLQSTLYWLPVWMVGALQGPAAASSIAVASRLAVAVASIMAAIRFTVRPEIVAAAARGDWDEIEKIGRTIATVASVAAFVALIGTMVVGGEGIALIFGDAYRSATIALGILLLGTIGECFGGPVDEVLRMTGRARFVLGLIAISVVSEAILIMLLGGSAVSAAAAQSAVFIVMYGVFIAYVRFTNGILIVPYFSIRKFNGRRT